MHYAGLSLKLNMKPVNPFLLHVGGFFLNYFSTYDYSYQSRECNSMYTVQQNWNKTNTLWFCRKRKMLILCGFGFHSIPNYRNCYKNVYGFNLQAIVSLIQGPAIRFEKFLQLIQPFVLLLLRSMPR